MIPNLTSSFPAKDNVVIFTEDNLVKAFIKLFYRLQFIHSVFFVTQSLGCLQCP